MTRSETKKTKGIEIRLGEGGNVESSWDELHTNWWTLMSIKGHCSHLLLGLSWQGKGRGFFLPHML